MALCDTLEQTQTQRKRQRDQLLAATLHQLTNDDADIPFAERATFYFNHLPSLTTRRSHVQQLRQMILNLAVRGKLVEQDEQDEPVDVLLQQIEQERLALSQKDRRIESHLQELLGSELCWEVPHYWKWRALADLALFIDYRGQTPVKIDLGIRLITAKNVRQGFISLEPEEFISEQTYESWMTRGIPTVGDILFTTEAPMGNVAVINLCDRFALAQRVICFRLLGELNPRFLTIHILSPLFQEILDFAATGLTAKGVKAAKLKRLPVAIPPLAEQHRIVAKVDELMALCDALEKQIEAEEDLRSRLLEASLHEALQDVSGTPAK